LAGGAITVSICSHGRLRRSSLRPADLFVGVLVWRELPDISAEASAVGPNSVDSSVARGVQAGA
jgi:hypothetical protein